MARYSQAFKAKVVARLLPPESATLEQVRALLPWHIKAEQGVVG